jgi:hypothetical protein
MTKGQNHSDKCNAPDISSVIEISEETVKNECQ